MDDGFQKKIFAEFVLCMDYAIETSMYYAK